MWDLEAAEEVRGGGRGVITAHKPMGSVAKYAIEILFTVFE